MTALIVPGNVKLPENFDLSLLKKFESTTFLPRLQIYQSQSEEVVNGTAQIGSIGIISGKDTVKFNGMKLDFIPLSVRYKAFDNNTKPPTTCYDPKSNVFLKIMEEAEKPGLNGYMAGVEALIYIPSLKLYATWFMANASAKMKILTITENLFKGLSLTTRSTKNARGRFIVPEIDPCVVALDPPDDQEAMDKVIENFNNPKATESPELAPAQSESRDQ